MIVRRETTSGQKRFRRLVTNSTFCRKSKKKLNELRNVGVVPNKGNLKRRDQKSHTFSQKGKRDISKFESDLRLRRQKESMPVLTNLFKEQKITSYKFHIE